jgi:hypothetical protein
VNGACRTVAALIVLAWAGSGLGQSGDVAPGLDPKACTDEQRLRLDAERRPRDPSNQDPGEKLAQTEGVLCPPNVDPQIKLPAPDTGKMPVVPPPGSPGGDPNVRPK